jgi:hypothetical protein
MKTVNWLDNVHKLHNELEHCQFATLFTQRWPSLLIKIALILPSNLRAHQALDPVFDDQGAHRLVPIIVQIILYPCCRSWPTSTAAPQK